MTIANKEKEISGLLVKIQAIDHHEKETEALKIKLEASEAEKNQLLESRKNLENELNSVKKILEQETIEKNNLKAAFDAVALEKVSLDERTQKIINLEAEIRALVHEQEKSGKALHQMHEAKVLVNESISSPQAELIPAIQCLIQEFIKTQDALKEESERIKDQAEKTQKQQEENALLLHKLEESTKTYTQAVGEFEQQIVAKDQYIQALIFDVNQMKEFIVEHHGESIFEEKDEKEVTQPQVVEETIQKEEEIHQKEEEVIEEVAEPKEEESPIKEEQVIATEEETAEVQQPETVPEETAAVPEPETKKVVVVVEKPVYHNRYDSYNNYDNRGYYNRGGYYDRKRYDRPYKPYYKDDYYYGSRRNSYYEEPVQEPVKEEPVKEEPVKEEPVKEVGHWDKRTREEDPSFKQLEKMIIELNEKLINSEKRAKKALEEKLEEAAKAAEEKEQEFMRQIEMVQEEKKALLKKIDDMQWDRAYEYTEKMKTQKKEEVQPVDNKAAKKKNKK